jgi:mRNA interferase MazF
MEVKLPSGLPITGVVLVDHIRSVDREARKMEVVGQAPQQVLDEIDARLAPLLNL